MFESEQAHQFVVGGPGIAAPLTALIKPPLMYPSHMIEELVQAGGIATHPVIVVIPAELGIQQLLTLLNWDFHPIRNTKLCLAHRRLSTAGSHEILIKMKKRPPAMVASFCDVICDATVRL